MWSQSALSNLLLQVRGLTRSAERSAACVGMEYAYGRVARGLRSRASR